LRRAEKSASLVAINLDRQPFEDETRMNLKSGLIKARTDNAIGWLIFDNPTKLNALSPGMSEDALSVIEAYDADAEPSRSSSCAARARSAFISGGDISSFEKTRANAEDFAEGGENSRTGWPSA
jgi:enoyl-CoA hydratase/carnithine racemase